MARIEPMLCSLECSTESAVATQAREIRGNKIFSLQHGIFLKEKLVWIDWIERLNKAPYQWIINFVTTLCNKLAKHVPTYQIDPILKIMQAYHDDCQRRTHLTLYTKRFLLNAFSELEIAISQFPDLSCDSKNQFFIRQTMAEMKEWKIEDKQEEDAIKSLATYVTTGNTNFFSASMTTQAIYELSIPEAPTLNSSR